MKAQDLRGKTAEELRAVEKELREKMFRLQMKQYTGQLEKVSELRNTKQDIARVLTVLGER
jgi:large subunit ribosomal protein L29